MSCQKIIRVLGYLFPALFLIPIVFDVELFSDPKTTRSVCILIVVCMGLYGFMKGVYNVVKNRDIFAVEGFRVSLSLDKCIKVTCRMVSWTFIVSGVFVLFVMMPYLMLRGAYRAGMVLFGSSVVIILLGILITKTIAPFLIHEFGSTDAIRKKSRFEPDAVDEAESEKTRD